MPCMRPLSYEWPVNGDPVGERISSTNQDSLWHVLCFLEGAFFRLVQLY